MVSQYPQTDGEAEDEQREKEIPDLPREEFPPCQKALAVVFHHEAIILVNPKS